MAPARVRSLPRPARLVLVALLLVVVGLGAGFGVGQATSPANTVAPAPGQPGATAAARAGLAARRPPSLPAPVARALAERRPIVLLFVQPGGADDDATAAAVRDLSRGRNQLGVFVDRVDHLGRYRPIVSGMQITQVPAVVIVGRDRRARLVEGFVDEASLRQHVADVLR